MARILCISDLHYSKGKKDNLKGELENKTLTDTLNLLENALINSFANDKKIDIIVFCGDYIYGPNNSEVKEEAFKNFLQFLDRISDKKNSLFNNDNPADHIFIVPGNHDIVRKTDGDCLENFKNKTQKYRTPFSDNSNYAPVFIFKDLKLIFACESTVNNSDSTNPEVEQFISKIEKADFQDPNIKAELLKFLNSQERYDVPTIESKAKSRFIESNNRIIKDLKDYNQYLKIVLTHHPLLSGAERFITVKEFDKTIGGYEFLRTAVNFGYEMFIHGHLHEQSCLQFQDFSDKAFSCPVVQLGIPRVKAQDNDSGIILIETYDNKKFDIAHLELNELDCKLNNTKLIYRVDKSYNSIYIDKQDHILVDYEIKDLINSGEIIKGGNLDNVEAASYDCALGYKYKRSCVSSNRYNWSDEVIKMQKNGPAKITLNSNETILIYTREEFDLPNDMVLHASPISSWLRKGISVDLSFFVDPGFKGKFCFPVTNKNSNSIEIRADEPIVSVEIVKLSRSCEKTWAQRHQDKAEIREEYKDN